MTAEAWGYASALFFALCVIPQALKSYRDGHSEGISGTFIILLMVALITGMIYAAPRDVISMLLSYISNFTGYMVIAYYKAFPRSHHIQMMRKIRRHERRMKKYEEDL